MICIHAHYVWKEGLDREKFCFCDDSVVKISKTQLWTLSLHVCNIFYNLFWPLSCWQKIFSMFCMLLWVIKFQSSWLFHYAHSNRCVLVQQACSKNISGSCTAMHNLLSCSLKICHGLGGNGTKWKMLWLLLYCTKNVVDEIAKKLHLQRCVSCTFQLLV